jgi:uncharacterized protein YciW
LAAAIAEHFASIPVPEEDEVIDQFLRALHKNRTSSTDTEESADDNSTHISSKKSSASLDHSKKKQDRALFSDSEPSSNANNVKNSLQSNSKKSAVKRNSIPKNESKHSKV